MLPATATLIGIIVLAQIPSLKELLGIALIVVAVALHRDHTAQDHAEVGECTLLEPQRAALS
jgi:inner membrane transporter RhtA